MSVTLLVAQPSRTLMTLMRLALESGPWELECVSDGTEALQSARHTSPALVIADISLAGLDGYQLTEAVRQLSGLEEVPVLITAAAHEAPDTERIKHLQINDVITKPFERQALVDRVQSLVGEGARPSSADTAAPITATTTQISDDAVQDMVDRRLSALVDDALTENIRSMVDARIGAALEHSLGRIEEITRDAVAARVDEAIENLTPPLVDAQVGETVRKVVWKVVPELAMDLIREEIERLTEDD